ncbi:MAG TPA: hypothetical protein VMR52_07890, partial [Dehalococcoidia bacterium]|nr:hypothetical protein [Dehalococcoidia bacterium]
TVTGTRPDAPAQGAPPVLVSPLDTSPVLSLLHPLTAWSLHFSRGGSVTIFIRSDIFSHIQPLTVEQDKLPIRRIAWDDKELLMKVIDERFEHAAEKFSADKIWQALFPAEVTGIPTKDWIALHTMHRPRDIIYFLKEAIAMGVNRDHKAVTEDDLIDAREKYSQYVFSSVLSEDSPHKGKLEAVLYEFAGAPRVLEAEDVVSRIRDAGVHGADLEFYIDLLCDINFLGIETTSGFKLAADESERRTLRNVAAKLAERSGAGEKYEINPPFYQVLQVE